MKKALSWCGLLLFGAVLLGWFVWLRPPALGGGTSIIVVSGDSMRPGLQPGDLVLARDTDDYQRGDVAVYEIPEGQPGSQTEARIIHRLTGGDAEHGFETRGDNRDAADPWTPSADDIVGEQWYVVPGGGDVLAMITQPALVGAAAGGLATFFVIARGGRRRREDAEA